jgi:hypothetical protein
MPFSDVVNGVQGGFQNLLTKMQTDPAFNAAVTRFAAGIAQPYDPSKANPLSVTTGALADSTEYLRQIREKDAKAALETRGVAAQERGVGAQEQVAQTGVRRAGLEEKIATEGDIPLKQAQAENLRNNTKAERALLKMQQKLSLETGGAKWDNDLMQRAIDLVQMHTEKNPDDERTPEQLTRLYYNNMAPTVGVATLQPLLSEITDEQLEFAVGDDSLKQEEFRNLYGRAGAHRLITWQQKRAKANAPPAGTPPPSVTEIKPRSYGRGFAAPELP